MAPNTFGTAGTAQWHRELFGGTRRITRWHWEPLGSTKYIWQQHRDCLVAPGATWQPHGTAGRERRHRVTHLDSVHVDGVEALAPQPHRHEDDDSATLPGTQPGTLSIPFHQAGNVLSVNCQNAPKIGGGSGQGGAAHPSAPIPRQYRRLPVQSCATYTERPRVSGHVSTALLPRDGGTGEAGGGGPENHWETPHPHPPTPGPCSPEDVGNDGGAVPVAGLFAGTAAQLHQPVDAERRPRVVGEPGHEGAVPPLSVPGQAKGRRGGPRLAWGVLGVSRRVLGCLGVLRLSWRVLGTP